MKLVLKSIGTKHPMPDNSQNLQMKKNVSTISKIDKTKHEFKAEQQGPQKRQKKYFKVL